MDVEIILKTQDPDEARRFLDAIRPKEAAVAPQPDPTSAPTVPATSEPSAFAGESTALPPSPGSSEEDDFTAPPRPTQPPLKFAADPHVTDKELMDMCGQKVEALIAAGKKKPAAMALIKGVIGKYVGEGASPSTMGQGSRTTFLRELGELA